MNADEKLIAAMVQQFNNYPSIERAVLFGSRARGDNCERSDYDVAVYGSVTKADEVGLRSAFEDGLPTLHGIDLIFMDTLPAGAFRTNIENEGVTIYEKA